MTQSPWVFVTDRADVHADRFHRLFRDIHPGCERLDVALGSDGNPHTMRNGVALTSWDDICDSLGDAAVVITGPLDTISQHLVGGTYRHVGISWATDIMVSAATSSTIAGRIQEAVVSMDAVVTDNYATENALVAMGVASESIIRIPWGPQPLEGEDRIGVSGVVRERWGIPRDKRVILYPRALEPHYDPLVFVEALSKLTRNYPDVCAVVVESGSSVAAAKEAVSQAGLEDTVMWVSTLATSEFHALVEESTMVVVTPQTDGTSVSVMEAMVLGTPVVTSHTSGSAEWVMDGITGWSFPVGSSEGLYSAMARCLDASNAEISSITDRAKRLVDSRAGWSRSADILSKALKAL